MKLEVRIAVITPSGQFGEKLLNDCYGTASRLERQFLGLLHVEIVPCQFTCVSRKNKKRINGCDIGIAYGDLASKWVSDNMRDVPFLLMSAADMDKMSEHHLKAYPSAATMGVLLAKLSLKLIGTDKSARCRLCALFENSDAGKACRIAYEGVIHHGLSEIGKILETQTLFYEQGDLQYISALVDSMLAGAMYPNFFCVYGFSTSGDAYGNLMVELQRRRDDNPRIYVVTDVNVPQGIDPSAVVCGVEHGNPCVGISFFSRLMSALIELVAKSAMWSTRKPSTSIRQAVVEYGLFASTSMGTLSFVNDELIVPFCCLVYGELCEIEKFRDVDVSREAVSMSMACIEKLSAKISRIPLHSFETSVLASKQEVFDEILAPCFGVRRVYFIDEDAPVLNDAVPVRRLDNFVITPGIIQVAYDDRDVENTDVLQLYVLSNGMSVEPITFAKDIPEEKIDGVVAGTDTHEAECKAKRNILLMGAKDARDFIHDLRVAYDKDAPYLYCVCLNKGNGRSTAGMVVYADVKFRNIELAALKNVAERFFGSIHSLLRLREVQIASMKSAIGSIMSRNGSHNIGSHVLAALSHNVGTMPDDRVLYQYIQHRMDYIATVTTDFPTWTQPTMFVGALMRTFLSQRHLLDHITESEGLSSWQFQNPNLMSKEEWKAQQNRLKIMVRRRMVDGTYVDFIRYDDPNGTIPLKDDISLAIPGGAVGQHAFYTILENVIRNAAKHDWSVMDEAKKRAVAENLSLYIDFEDDPASENVVFEVWTKLTPVTPHSDSLSELDSLEEEAVLKFRTQLDEETGCEESPLVEFDSLPVHQRQQVLIERSFIGSNGDLRRENWGLAEMKISAGYLQRRLISDIGGINETTHGPEAAIILPCLKNYEGKHYLCYRFTVPKPRELLVIVNEDLSAHQARVQTLRNYGVFVKRWSDIEEAQSPRAMELNYRFVIHPDITLNTIRTNRVKFPFRVLCGRMPPDDLKRYVPELSYYNALVEELLDDKKDAEDAATDMLKAVYQCWCQFVSREEREEIKEDGTVVRGTVERKIGLVVAPYEGSGTIGSGHSLIADSDVLKFVMRESFTSCIDQFLSLEQYDVNEPFAELLKSLKMCEKAFSDLEQSDTKEGFSLSREIAKYIQRMLEDVKECDNEITALKEAIVDRLKKSYGLEQGRPKQTGEGLKGKIARRTDAERATVAERLTLEQSAGVVGTLLEEHPIDRFIRYMETMHEHTAKIFKQYEEKIVSLPKGYAAEDRESDREDDGKQKQANDRANNDKKKKSDCGFPVLWCKMPSADELSKDDTQWLAYRRHDFKLTDKIIYAEPLSGTQSYLTQLIQMTDGDPASVENLALRTRLVENGLMKLLVLDERVAKFVREHSNEVEQIYRSMKIAVVDDKQDEKGAQNQSTTTHTCFATDFKKSEVVSALETYVQCGNARDSSDGQTNMSWPAAGKSLRQYDMLIVHQGILDKWFPKFKNSRESMQKLIEGLKKVIRYVVITTGRGMPPNIPEDAHLVPFAVVEAALFRKYPEKLILVDTIMNVVPIGKTEGEG